MSEKTLPTQTKPLVNTKVKRGAGRPAKHSLQEKHQALRAYLTEGTFEGASRVTGINHSTIRSWIKTDWWKETEEAYRAELEEQYRTRGTKIILKAQDAIIDRLENGDVYIDKSGKERKRPVSMREATFAYGVTYDKMRVSLEKPTQVVKTDQPVVTAQTGPTEAEKDWLLELANKFVQATRVIEARPIEDSQRYQTSQPQITQAGNSPGDEKLGGDRPVDITVGNGLPEATLTTVES